MFLKYKDLYYDGDYEMLKDNLFFIGKKWYRDKYDKFEYCIRCVVEI